MTVDLLPKGEKLLVFPGDPYTLRFTWPDALTGRTFTAFYGEDAATATVDDDSLIVEFTAASRGVSAVLVVETTGADRAVFRMPIQVSPSTGRSSGDVDFTVADGDVNIPVQVIGGFIADAIPDGTYGDVEIDGADWSVPGLAALAAADVALDGRLDVIEAISIATDAELAAGLAGKLDTTTAATTYATLASLATEVTNRGNGDTAAIATAASDATTKANAAQAAAISAAATDATTKVGVETAARIADVDAEEARALAAEALLAPRRFVDVKSFGATGDGTTDDSIAVGMAIGTLVSGDCLYFPRGQYLVGNLSVVLDAVTIAGAGFGSKLLAKTGTTGDLLTVTGAYNIVRDLNFSGNDLEVCLLRGHQATRFNVHRVRFGNTTGSGGHGLRLTGNDGATTHAASITNVWAYTLGGTAIWGASYCYDARLQDIWIGVVNKGIVFADGNASFTNCHVWSSVSDAMTIVGNGDRVQNCYLEHAGGYGLRIGTTVTHATIGNVEFWGNGTGGVYVDGGALANIHDCMFRDNIGPAVTFHNHQRGVVSGCTAYADGAPVQTYAVVSDGTSDRLSISGNQFPRAAFSTGTLSLVGSGNRVSFEAVTVTATNITPPTDGTSTTAVAAFPYLAGEKGIVEGWLIVSGGQTPDIQVRCRSSNALTAGWFGLSAGPNNSTTSTTSTSINPNQARSIATNSTGITIGLVGVGTLQLVMFRAYVDPASDGTLTIAVLEANTDATAPIVEVVEAHYRRIA